MNFRYENKKFKLGYSHIIGCDEVGRGCLAGPVAAAAVILPAGGGELKVESYKVIKSAGIRDSKLLGPEKREKLSAIIKDNCLAWGIGIVDEKVIDKINIYNATLLAMKRAVENLTEQMNTDIANGLTQITDVVRAGGLHYKDNYLLAVDGKFTIPSFASDFAKASSDKKATEGKPDFYMEQEAVIDGDNKILSIAAASIIAKVYRDDLMRKLHRKYPIYNFWQHKGYGTLFHRTMILKNGLSPIHRRSFCKNLSGARSPSYS